MISDKVRPHHLERKALLYIRRCILRGARLTSEAWIGSTKIVLYYMSAMREAGHVISIDRRKT